MKTTKEELQQLQDLIRTGNYTNIALTFTMAISQEVSSSELIKPWYKLIRFLHDIDLLHIDKEIASEDHQVSFQITENTLVELFSIRRLWLEPFYYTGGSLKKKQQFEQRLLKLLHSISDLKMLEDIALVDYPNLKTIPPSWIELKLLHQLRLRKCQIKKIPALPQIIHLNLANNEIERIHSDLQISACVNLEELDLSMNKLNDLPQNFELLQQLKDLLLQENEFGYVPEVIGELKKLERLNLAFNPVLYKIPKSLGQLKNLESLDLMYCAFRDFPKAVLNIISLEYLNLAYNTLDELPKGIGKLEHLYRLDLRGNQFKTFPKALEELEYLKVLSLSFNSIQNVVLEPKNIMKLERLDLSQNDLSEVEIDITKFPNLQQISLNGNAKLLKIKGLNESTLEVSLLSTPLIRYHQVPTEEWGMAVQYINLSYRELKSLPKILEEFEELQELRLYNNQLNTLPPFLAEFKQLRYLHLGNNNLRSLPNCIEELEQLEFLELENNPIQELPDFIQQLPNLRYLGLKGTPIEKEYKARQEKNSLLDQLLFSLEKRS